MRGLIPPANPPESSADLMIDYLALTIGHALIALTMVRLFMRADVDVDPLIGGLQDQMRANQKNASAAGRNAKRRAAMRAAAQAGEGSDAARAIDPVATEPAPHPRQKRLRKAPS